MLRTPSFSVSTSWICAEAWACALLAVNAKITNKIMLTADRLTMLAFLLLAATVVPESLIAPDHRVQVASRYRAYEACSYPAS